MFSSFSRVGFCGSRSLPASALPLVSSVVSSVLAGSRASLAVGCSVGADAFVLSSVPRGSLCRLSVFATFGRGGAGSCPVSAVPAVVAALRGGASVRWWAGGGASVPLRVRLAARSVALVRFLSSSRSSALVCFLSSPRSRGSLLACRVAARLGVSVFVFCVGFSPARLPRLGRGSWVPVSLVGGLAARWVLAQKSVRSTIEKSVILEWITASLRKSGFIVALLAFIAHQVLSQASRVLPLMHREDLRKLLSSRCQKNGSSNASRGGTMAFFSTKSLSRERVNTHSKYESQALMKGDEVSIITFEIVNASPSDRQKQEVQDDFLLVHLN